MALLLNLSEINMNYLPDKMFLLGCGIVTVILILESLELLNN